MFSIISLSCSFYLFVCTSTPGVRSVLYADDANIVSESTKIVDVSPSITTNVIGQKADETGTDMCERSCEELSTMFQELKGLRVVVSNLIDGLQKVVSSRSDAGKISTALACVCFRMNSCLPRCTFEPKSGDECEIEEICLCVSKENQQCREKLTFQENKWPSPQRGSQEVRGLNKVTR